MDREEIIKKYANRISIDHPETDKVIIDLQQMVSDLKSMTVAERREQVGIEPKRADVLLAGAMIMWRTMEKLRFPNCCVSSRGLRYGVLIDL